MSNEVLKISNLVKKYDNSDRVILNNLDLTINDEDFLCILGPSGCGKSTLIRCIAGFEDYEGSIKVDGQPVVKPGPDRIMVFQDFNQLFPWKTVLKNITYALKVNGIKDKAEREQKATDRSQNKAGKTVENTARKKPVKSPKPPLKAR